MNNEFINALICEKPNEKYEKVLIYMDNLLVHGILLGILMIKTAI